MREPLSTTPEELFMLIGEERFLRFKVEQQSKKLYAQIEEMSQTITKLREENGRLEAITPKLSDNGDGLLGVDRGIEPEGVWRD